MELYNEFLKKLDKFITYIVVFLMIILVANVFSNIIVRYFGFSFLWSDGVARLTFVWLAFCGIYLGYRNNDHPSFSMIVKFAQNKNKFVGKIMRLIINFSVLGFLYILIYGGWKYIIGSSIQRIAVLNISVGWKYAAGPVLGFFIALESIRKIITIIKE